MSTTIGQHQLTPVTTPVPGGPLSADTVRGHVNDTIDGYNDHDADGGIHVQSGTSFPVSPTNGDKFINTNERKLYERIGGQWVSIEGRAFNNNSQGFPVIQDEGSVSGAITLDWSTGVTKKITLIGNVTGITHNNRVAGSTYQLIIVQGGSGGYTIDLSSYSWGSAGTPTIGSSLTAISLLLALYDGAKMLGYRGPLGA